MLLLLFLSRGILCTSSLVCICKDLLCADKSRCSKGINVLDPEGSDSRNFYESMFQIIKKSNKVELYIQKMTSQESYEPKINFGFFENKHVEITSFKAENFPNSLVFVLSHEDNLEKINLSIKVATEIKITRDSQDEETLFKLGYIDLIDGSSISISPSSIEVSCKTSSSSINFLQYISFKLVAITSNDFTLHLTEGGDYSLSFSKTEFILAKPTNNVISTNNAISTCYEFKEGAIIRFSSSNEVSLKLESTESNELILDFDQIKAIIELEIVGIWPSTSEKPFSIGNINLDYSIVIKSEYVPFEFSGKSIKMTVLSNSTILGTIKTYSTDFSDKLTLYSSEEIGKKFSLRFQKANTNIVFMTGDVFLTIDNLVATGNEFPIEFFFSKTGISIVDIKSVIWSSEFVPIYLEIYSNLDKNVDSKSILDLFTTYGEFMKLPLSDYSTKLRMSLYFHPDGQIRPGFKVHDIWLKYDITSDLSQKVNVYTFKFKNDWKSYPVTYAICDNKYDSTTGSGKYVQVPGNNEVKIDDLIIDDFNYYVFELYSSNVIFSQTQVKKSVSILIKKSQPSTVTSSITTVGLLMLSVDSITLDQTNTLIADNIIMNKIINNGQLNIETGKITCSFDVLKIIPSDLRSKIKEILVHDGNLKLIVSQQLVKILNMNDEEVIIDTTTTKVAFKVHYRLSIESSGYSDGDDFMGFDINVTKENSNDLAVTIIGFDNKYNIISPIRFQNSDYSMKFKSKTSTNMACFKFDSKINVVYDTDYGNAMTICIQTESCSGKNINLTDVGQTIMDSQIYDITISSVGNGVLSESSRIIIPLKAFNKRKITIQFYVDNFLEIDNSEPNDDLNFSYFSLSSKSRPCNFYVSNPEKPIKFANFIITNNNNNNYFKIPDNHEIRLEVSRLTATLPTLMQFKEITILDEISGDLKIDSNFVDKDCTINFVEDDNPNDLSLSISSPQDIFVGEGFIKFGNNVYFKVPRTNYFDIKIKSTKSLTFTVLDNVDADKIPKIDFTHSGFSSANLIFKGKWNKATEPIFSIKTSSDISFDLESVIPAELLISTVIKSIKITAMSTNVGFQFPIIWNEYQQNEKIRSLDLMVDEEKVTSDVLFEFRGKIYNNGEQKNADVNQIILSSPLIFAKFYGFECILEGSTEIGKDFDVYLKMDKDNISKVDFGETKGINTIKNIEVTCDLANNLDFDEIMLYREKSIDIIKGDELLISKNNNNRVFKNINANPTFGFGGNANVVGFISKEQNINISIEKSIFDMIYYIQFDMNSEWLNGYFLMINDESKIIESIKTNVKEQIKKIHFSITSNINTVLDFSLLEGYSFDIVFDGLTLDGHQVPIKLGSCMNNVEFRNVHLLSTIKAQSSNILPFGNNMISIQKMVFADSSIESNSFEITDKILKLSTDADSLKYLVENSIIQASYSNDIVVTSARHIKFCSNGWKIREMSGKKEVTIPKHYSESGKLKFEADDPIVLNLEPTSLSEIIPIDFNIISKSADGTINVNLGNGWNKVKNADQMKIKTNASNVKIYTASYPIPNIFGSLPTNVSFDGSGETDFSLLDEYDLIKDLYLDMTEIQESEPKLKANTINCKSNSTISFAENKGVLTVSNVYVDDNLIVKFPKTSFLTSSKLQMRQESALIGNIIPHQTTDILMYWQLNRFPQIKLSSQTNEYPASIKIIFDVEEVNNITYNNALINQKFEIISGKFPCAQWLASNVVFEASTIPEFSSNDPEKCIFSKECGKSKTGDDALMVRVVKLLPTPTPTPSPSDDSEGKAKLSSGAIAGIAVSAAIVVGVVIGVVVFLATRKKYVALLSTARLEGDSDNAVATYSI